MTPHAASHAEQSRSLGVHRARSDSTASAIARLLDVRVWSQMRLLVDAVVLCLASIAALYAGPIPDSGRSQWIAGVFPLLTLVLLRARRDPDERLHVSPLDTAAYVLGVVSLSAMMTIAAGSIVGGSHPVGLAVRLWLFAAVYLTLARLALGSVRLQASRNEALAMPTLIMGAGSVGELLVKRMTEDGCYGMRPVGYLDADPLPRLGTTGARAIPVLGGPSDLETAVARTGARRLILAFSSEPDRVLVDKVAECQKLGVEVLLVPRLFEAINDRVTVDHIGEVPLLSLRPTNPRSWEFTVKHAIDRSAALVSLIVLAPLFAAVALAVRLSSSGPVLFRQYRVGRDGREFTMLKFRTMRGDPAVVGEADAGWAAQLLGESASPGRGPEDRITGVGRFLRKTSIDELPQLINVLRGDMSLVGPRPERVSYVRDFERVVYRYTDRHRVKSGLTGWAQVNGLRGETSIADRVKWDNYYIQNWSLKLDLKIMMLTFAEVLRFRDSQKARKYGPNWARKRRRG